MKQANKPTTITLSYEDVSDEDCSRYDIVTYVDGKNFLLAPSALGGEFTTKEVEKKAKEFFGDDVIINW